MQIMAKFSEEGKMSGLGWIDAKVIRFKSENTKNYILPHMGWNDVKLKKNNLLLNKILNPRFYFLHSYDDRVYMLYYHR